MKVQEYLFGINGLKCLRSDLTRSLIYFKNELSAIYNVLSTGIQVHANCRFLISKSMFLKNFCKNFLRISLVCSCIVLEFSCEFDLGVGYCNDRTGPVACQSAL